MSIAILIRGLSGSGKSTLAKSLVNYLPTVTHRDYVHLENDMLRKIIHGEYKFEKGDYDRIREISHIVCKVMIENMCDVVLSNVFTTEESIEEYKLMFDKVIVIRCISSYDSIYDVSEEEMENMKSKFEDIEGEILYDSSSMNNYTDLIVRLCNEI